MVCNVKIKGRKEGIECSDTRGKALKQAKETSPPGSWVEIGPWSGEIGQIIGIEFSSNKTPDIDYQEKYHREFEEEVRDSPEVRGKKVGRFRWYFKGKRGFKSGEPSDEIIEKVQKIQTDYYRAHPRAFNVPIELFKELL